MKFCLVLLCVPLGWAQLLTNSIEITASRTASASPDQAAFDVLVGSDFGTSLADILSALSPAGITADNLVGLLPLPGLLFNMDSSFAFLREFNLNVPLAKLTATASQLATLQKNSGLSITFSLHGVSTPPACVIGDLVADATVQAQKLADLANLRLGPVLAISDSTRPSFSFTSARSFVSLTGFLLNYPVSPGPLNCAVTVKFGIVRL